MPVEHHDDDDLAEEEEDEELYEDEEELDPDFLEICVESLVGTVFEMRLSKFETIDNIKMRLQRLEGIPKAHMHLLYRGIFIPTFPKDTVFLKKLFCRERAFRRLNPTLLWHSEWC